MRSALLDNFSVPPRNDWLRALGWTAVILALPIGFALAGSFVSYTDAAAHGHPWLRGWMPVCGGCPLCGMTRAFCALSAGDFEAARRWNRGGIFLYAASWMWLAAVTTWGIRRIRQIVRQRVTLSQRAGIMLPQTTSR